MPITVEARREFVRENTKLSIWFARRLSSRRCVTLRETLTACTDVYRCTSLFDGKNHPADTPGFRDERWEKLMVELQEISARCPAGDTSTEMEEEGLALFWPLLEERIAAAVARWPTLENRPFGMFSYRTGDYGWEDGRVTLHLGNPFAPASPFADMQRCARDLGRLLTDAAARNSGLTTVYCSSWLVDFPPFLTLFPAEFGASLRGPSPLAYHMGWWGQMIDRGGGFHFGNGQWLRRTGEFRWRCVQRECSVEAAHRWLKERWG